MNQISTLPSEMNAGLDFNYAVWTAGTSITLCNVPWNSDYRDITKFDNVAALDNYLLNNSGPVTTIPGLSYARVGQPIRVSLPQNAVYKYNYLRAFNPAQPVQEGDTPRAFYYFITDTRHIAPNNTEIMVQLDVWQSFGYGVSFGNCFIERGHVGIANENAMRDYGREFLTIPEGLDIGGEYEIVAQWKEKVASAKSNVDGGLDYSIMITSTTSLTGNHGTVDAPNLVSANGSTFENLPNGAETYVFKTLPEFKIFMEFMADKPWVTQGIVSITAIPPVDRYGMDVTEIGLGNVGGDQVSIYEIAGEHSFQVKPVEMATAWRETLPIPERYAHLDKFKVHPYTSLEMTSYTGTPLVLKPESWANDDAVVIEVPHFAPPGARLMFIPWRYNRKGRAGVATGEIADDFEEGLFNDGGEFLDVATGIFNFPTFSVVNNGYISMMAANTHGIAFQHSNNEWSQQRALAGAQAGYDNAGTGIDASKIANAQGISAASQQATLANEMAGWNALQGVGNNLTTVQTPLNLAKGLANNAADYAKSLNQSNQSLGIANHLSEGVNQTQTNSSQLQRDTNMDYAQMAAKGDYQNGLAGINAKVQDARLIQPTTSGQLGGDTFNLAMYKWGYDIKVKMLQGAAMATMGEFWLRYGYRVNRFGKMPASLMVCEKFTYWKLQETYITAANCPETYKQTLRGIFEKGVTVWKNPNDIGVIDMAGNAPLAGVTL